MVTATQLTERIRGVSFEAWELFIVMDLER